MHDVSHRDPQAIRRVGLQQAGWTRLLPGREPGGTPAPGSKDGGHVPPRASREGRDLRRRLIYHADLLGELVGREIKIRYKRSILGIAWTLLNPLSQVLVFAFVFRYVLPLGIPDYPSFLFTGILAWGWFQTSLLSGSTAIVDNGALIRQPGFPIAILPVVTTATHLVHFLLALLVLLPFLALTGHRLSMTLALLPALVGLQFLLSLSLAYLVAPLHVSFRDTQYTLGVLLLLGFYLTPVFYDSASIPAQYWVLYRLNPLVHLIGAYRDIILRGRWPDPSPLVLLASMASGLLLLGYRTFVRASYHFVEDL
jgi:lipopolysaccharide transport system permease protein